METELKVDTEFIPITPKALKAPKVEKKLKRKKKVEKKIETPQRYILTEEYDARVSYIKRRLAISTLTPEDRNAYTNYLAKLNKFVKI